MGALLEALRVMKIHSVLAGIALPNAPSVALCEKFGFAKVGQLAEVGYNHDQGWTWGTGESPVRERNEAVCRMIIGFRPLYAYARSVWFSPIFDLGSTERRDSQLTPGFLIRSASERA